MMTGQMQHAVTHAAKKKHTHTKQDFITYLESTWDFNVLSEVLTNFGLSQEILLQGPKDLNLDVDVSWQLTGSIFFLL